MKTAGNRTRGIGRVQLAAVFRKELIETVRDRRIMFLLIVAPFVQTIVFGFAVNFDVDHVPAVVVDLDRSPTSRSHARRLLADGTLARYQDTTSVSDAESHLEDGSAAAIVLLPKGLGADLLADRPTAIQVILDGTDPNRATVVSGAALRYFGDVGEELSRQALGRSSTGPPARASLVPKIAYNPGLRTAIDVIPAVMGILLLIVTTVVTAMGMSRERETGTLEQVLVTPIRPVYLLIGKMAPFLAIGILDVCLVLTASTFLFDLPVRGSLVTVFLATFLYVLSTLGVGLFISTVSRTQQQSFLGGVLFVLPAVLLSGGLSPLQAMPDWLATITYINPLRYYTEVLRAALLKGATLAELRFQICALLGFGITIVAAATLRFRKRLG